MDLPGQALPSKDGRSRGAAVATGAAVAAGGALGRARSANGPEAHERG
jgi:hypothetical protein